MTDQMALCHKRDYALKGKIDAAIDLLLQIEPAFRYHKRGSDIDDAIELLDEERASIVRRWD